MSPEPRGLLLIKSRSESEGGCGVGEKGGRGRGRGEGAQRFRLQNFPSPLVCEMGSRKEGGSPVPVVNEAGRGAATLH